MFLQTYLPLEPKSLPVVKLLIQILQLFFKAVAPAAAAAVDVPKSSIALGDQHIAVYSESIHMNLSLD
jgi:hypothetical protein